MEQTQIELLDVVSIGCNDPCVYMGPETKRFFKRRELIVSGPLIMIHSRERFVGRAEIVVSRSKGGDGPWAWWPVEGYVAEAWVAGPLAWRV